MRIIKYVIYLIFVYVITIVFLGGIVIIADYLGYQEIRDALINVIKTISFTNNNL
jgi:hypothetical protein